MSKTGIILYYFVATPNQASSGQRRCCSTSTIENDNKALKMCPSLLSTPTLMDYYYALNAVLRRYIEHDVSCDWFSRGVLLSRGGNF